MTILNFAFYRFFDPLTLISKEGTPEECLQQLKIELMTSANELHLKGTLILSLEGLNGSLAGREEEARLFQKFLNTKIENLSYRESYSARIPFKNLYVKLKKEIIPFGDLDIQPSRWTAPRLSPTDLNQWFELQKKFTLLDTRNDYEVRYGTFKNAQHFQLDHFRDFPKKLLERAPQLSTTEPLVLFCTGGIRCEKAAAYAMKIGFQDVYQVEGGILDYFVHCGGAHYEGSCFVFDERVALDCQLQPQWQ